MDLHDDHTARSRLKIFHINMHHHWGGQPNRILTECLGLKKLGHDPWVAGPAGCMLVQRAHEAGLKTFNDLELKRGFRPASFLRDFRRLKELFRDEYFDVVHPHGSQDAWVSLFAVLATKPRPVLVRTRHNTFPVAGHLFNRWHYSKFNHVITISPQVNDLVTNGVGFPPENITAIYSAPDPERFFPRSPDPNLRAELGIPEGVPVIGKVARLAPEKGHHLFLRAAQMVRKRFPDARFVCVGKGRSRDDIEKLARELGLDDRLVLAGFRTDVPDIEALFDVFVLSPVSGESLGTSILEAFCMEKPVVATEVGGTGESVRDGETGYLVKSGPETEQVEMIARAILDLLENPDTARRMGKAGREMVLREFSPEQLAEKCGGIYAELVARGRRRGG
jgi:glycosyltransferase involved in cell wall biosynthesis